MASFWELWTPGALWPLPWRSHSTADGLHDLELGARSLLPAVDSCGPVPLFAPAVWTLYVHAAALAEEAKPHVAQAPALHLGDVQLAAVAEGALWLSVSMQDLLLQRAWAAEFGSAL